MKEMMSIHIPVSPSSLKFKMKFNPPNNFYIIKEVPCEVLGKNDDKENEYDVRVYTNTRILFKKPFPSSYISAYVSNSTFIQTYMTSVNVKELSHKALRLECDGKFYFLGFLHNLSNESN